MFKANCKNRCGTSSFSALYNYFLYYDIEKFSLHSIFAFLVNLKKEHITNAYWYLYLYIGLLLMLPILRKLVKNLENIDFYYLIYINLIFLGSIPIITHYFPKMEVSNLITLPFFSVYIVLFITGYFMHNFIVPSKRKAIVAVVLLVLLLCVQVVGTSYEFYKSKDSYLFYDKRTLSTITLGAICIFYVSKYMMENIDIPATLEKTIHKISSCTFGIFLLSDFLIIKLKYINQVLQQEISPLLGVLIFQILIFLVGFLVTYLIKKIPLVKRVL